MNRNHAIGKVGEHVGIRYLKQHGYTVLKKNLRIEQDEIDVIARTTSSVCCIEIKTTLSQSTGDAIDQITYQKVVALRRSARNLKRRTRFSGTITILVLLIQLDWSKKEALCRLVPLDG